MIDSLIPDENLNKNVMYIRDKKFFLMFLIAFLLVSIAMSGIVFTESQRTYSTNKVNIAASSETTYFYVDPPEVKDIMPGNKFKIKINITEAPETYSWEIYLSWDSNLLRLDYKKEGDFLHRGGAYETEFLSFPLTFDEANLEGEIMIGCSLSGDVPWASGDGWLCTLGFVVEAQGSSVLNLFDTRLWDYVVAGSPAHTYYPNLDGFFYNEPFHDIAVTNVTASPTKVEAGEPVTINVTALNEGNYSETFDVAVYADVIVYNTTVVILPPDIQVSTLHLDQIVVGDEIIVGMETGITLDAGDPPTTLTFIWDTTEVAEGNYTISAEAILLDDDTRENIFIDDTIDYEYTYDSEIGHFIDTKLVVGGWITLKSPAVVHNIAITNVTVSSTEVTVGEHVTINVTVENEGIFSEMFDVTVYYDDTAIANQTDITLANGTSTTLLFTWDTAGVPEGTYTISAGASVVEGETDTADNTYTDGTVSLRGAPASNIFIYATAVTAIIIIAAIVIYITKFRK